MNAMLSPTDIAHDLLPQGGVTRLGGDLGIRPANRGKVSRAHLWDRCV
jgi:hypothetical protein